MTKRAPWPMVVPAGTTTVGTARVRDDARPAMTTAQRRIYEKTGNLPPQRDDGTWERSSTYLVDFTASQKRNQMRHEKRASKEIK